MMFAEMWESISNWAGDLITILPTAGSEEPTTLESLQEHLDALVLPERPDVRILLARAGLPAETTVYYETFFNDFVHQLGQYVKAQYEDAVVKMGVQDASHVSVQTSYFRALRSGLIVYYNNSVQQALLNLKSRLPIPDSNSTILSTSTASTLASNGSESRHNRRGRPLIFSKEQTASLRALLAHDDQFSTEDKELIARTLNLSRAQVNRWFCNARARGGRKKPYEKPIPRAQRQNLCKYVSDVCQKQRSASSSSSSGSSTCSQYPTSDDDVDMWPSNALQQNSYTDDSPYLTTEADPSENIIPMAQLYSQISSACDDTSSTNQTMEMESSLASSNFSFSRSTSSLNEFLLPNDLSSLFNDPDPFNLNTLPDDDFAQSLSYTSSHSEQSWNFS